MTLRLPFPILLLCIFIVLNGVQAKLQKILHKMWDFEDTTTPNKFETFEDELETKLEKRIGQALWNKLNAVAKAVDEKRYDHLSSTLDQIKAVPNTVANKLNSVGKTANKTLNEFPERLDKIESLFTVLNKTLPGKIEKRLEPLKNVVKDVIYDIGVDIKGMGNRMEKKLNDSMSKVSNNFWDGLRRTVLDFLSDKNNRTLEKFVGNYTSMMTDILEQLAENGREIVREGADPFGNQLDEKFVNVGARLTPNITLDSTDTTELTTTTIFVSAAVIIVLINVVVIGIFWNRRRFKLLTKEEVENFRRGNNTGDLVGNEPFDCLEFPENLEICKTRLILSNVIGQGNFGEVYNATLTDIAGVGSTSVAVKKIKRADGSKESFKNILSELKVLCYVGSHLHVLEFLGAHIKEIGKGIVYIATELCENGSLDIFLRKAHASLHDGSTQADLINVTPNLNELARYAHEIALGMEYLSNKKIIHGDLSTRNVLLDSRYTCKIGDFGLSRKLNKYQILYQKKKEGAVALPWRWLAFESLKRLEFSTKSDVWSYGITLWEIYTLGEVPYPNHSFTNKFMDGLENGFRMSAPILSTDPIYLEMTRCWDINPQLRPSFKQLSEFFACARDLDNTPIIM